MDSGVVCFRTLKQALEKSELKFKATSDFVPASASITATYEVVVYTELLVMVLCSVK